MLRYITIMPIYGARETLLAFSGCNRSAPPGQRPTVGWPSGPPTRHPPDAAIPVPGGTRAGPGSGRGRRGQRRARRRAGRGHGGRWGRRRGRVAEVRAPDAVVADVDQAVGGEVCRVATTGAAEAQAPGAVVQNVHDAVAVNVPGQ